MVIVSFHSDPAADPLPTRPAFLLPILECMFTCCSAESALIPIGSAKRLATW
ncbi:hypothetical protein RE6C_00047 [Rhodopirellula europaea 6C]|uniref:Uncharacterized protein n=1 Tax=Rhodopirellula europaea 6C TaxID=1263867 RepID=M2B2L5_9BACT|nr:hypothetical protein RE6C_00047 [Rhodopirellula europaea 6C]